MSDGASSGEMGSDGRSSFIDISQARGEFSIPSKRNNFAIAILSRAFGSFSFDLKSKEGGLGGILFIRLVVEGDKGVSEQESV